MEKRTFEDLYKAYVRGIGIGQFSYTRFADWLIENYPGIVSRWLEDWLRKQDIS